MLFKRPKTSVAPKEMAQDIAHGAKIPASMSVLVVRPGFPDLKPANASTTNTRFFPALNDYYREASYGAFSITGTILPEPVLLTKPINSYGDMVDWPTGAAGRLHRLAADILTAASGAVDLTKHDVVMIVMPNNAPIRGMQSKVQINTSNGIITKSFFLLPEQYGPEVYAHELGHHLGLGDLYDEKIYENGGEADIYVGPWCLMSLVRGFFHFCAYHKIKLGWLPSERIYSLPLGMKTIIPIEPLEVKTKNFQVIKIPLDKRSYYLVEVRRRIGFDSRLPDEGLLVTLVNETVTDCMHSGDCYVKVEDAEPTTPGMQHAAFDLRETKNNIFVDKIHNLSITLVRREGDKNFVSVDTAPGLDR